MREDAAVTGTVVEPVPEGPPPSRRRWWWAVAALVLAVVLAGGVALAVADGGDGEGRAADSAAAGRTTTTTPSGPSTSSPSTTAGATGGGPDAAAGVLWPAPDVDVRVGSPENAARSFATEFLGFVEPVVGPYEAGDTRSGEVPVRPRADGPVTTVHVRQVTGDDWSVLGASTDAVVVAQPTAMATVSSPVPVGGEAWAFEGHVDVEVRRDGQRDPVGKGFATGGGDQLRPFRADVAFDAGGRPAGGAVVFLVHSAEDGRVWQAAAVRVRLAAGDECRTAAPTPASGEMVVTAYFTCSAAQAVRPVRRAVEASPGVLRASLDALVSGPTGAERRAGFASPFSDRSVGAVRSVLLRQGHAVVDFDDVEPAVADRRRLLAELDATVFQFNSVDDVEYRIDGDCRRFAERLGLSGGCDQPRTRADASGR